MSLQLLAHCHNCCAEWFAIPYSSVTLPSVAISIPYAHAEAVQTSHSAAMQIIFRQCFSCRHPLLHADYLTWKEASLRQEQRPKNAAGSVRRLATRKDVMAQNSGAPSDVSLWTQDNDSDSHPGRGLIVMSPPPEDESALPAFQKVRGQKLMNVSLMSGEAQPQLCKMTRVLWPSTAG